ncbi:hypothetical protein DBR45_45065 [Pseudomonas sp. HMWF031]|nr:hypothetical protein DBR45_45065 [Pseudomonas sp. HMWF031]
MKRNLKTILALAVSGLISTSAVAQSIGTGADNLAGGGNSVLNMLLTFLAIVGVLFVASGIIGLMQGRNGGGGESNGTHWGKIGGGAALASIMVVILMVTNQVFGDANEYEQTRTLIQGGAGSGSGSSD